MSFCSIYFIMALSIHFPFDDQFLTGFAGIVTSVIKTPIIQSIYTLFEEIKEEVIYELDHPEAEKVWT